MTNENARNLRKNQTDAERILWSRLRKKQLENYRFRRQHPIGMFIVDFVCLNAKLIIELDGSQHHDPDNVSYDLKRTEWLNDEGYTVVRFNNNDVFENINGVLHSIFYHLSRGDHR